MQKGLLLVLLTSLISLRPGVATIQAEAGNIAAAASKTLTSAEAQADFDLMRHALEEAHPGLYRYSTKAQMDRAFDAQRAKLNRSMKKTEFMAVIAETIAAIRCGHTGVQPDDAMKEVLKHIRTFPLRTLIEAGKLKVLFNDTPDDQTIRPGMEIVEINGHEVTDTLSRMLHLESADGDIETSKVGHVQRSFALYYWMLIEQAEEFTVKAKDPAGKAVVAKLAGVTEAERKTNQNPLNASVKANIAKMNWSEENQALRFLKEPDVAQIRLRYFVGDRFPQWTEENFKKLRDKGTKTLIIDLRGNGGGDDMYGAMLVSYLTDKPFRYFDHINVKTITPSFKERSDWREADEAKLRDGATPNPDGGYLVTAKLHRGVVEQPPANDPFLGKVFVLIDGGTFSTAADFCAVVHHLKRATFIGEETGGGYYGNNSGMMPTLTLPNSKFRIRLPMYEYWNAVAGYDGKRRGTIPDHVVEMKTAGLLRGVDEALELALKLAQAN